MKDKFPPEQKWSEEEWKGRKVADMIIVKWLENFHHLLSWMEKSLYNNHYFIVVQSLSHVQLFVTPWTAAHQASLSFTISQSLLKSMAIESVMPSNHLIGHMISCTHSNLPQWTFAFCMLRKLRLHSNLMFSISSLKFGDFFKFLAIFSFWNSSPPMMSTFLSQPLAPRSHLQSYP